MNFIKQLFNKEKIECPRCLGKGNVDWDDIKRLKNELKWEPGPCAYCNGSGEISPSLLSKIAVDTAYLTIDLPLVERKKLITNDYAAKERALYFDFRTDHFILEVEYLHFIGNLSVNKIVEFYLLGKDEVTPDAKVELTEYINLIIQMRTDN